MKVTLALSNVDWMGIYIDGKLVKWGHDSDLVPEELLTLLGVKHSVRQVNQHRLLVDRVLPEDEDDVAWA